MSDRRLNVIRQEDRFDFYDFLSGYYELVDNALYQWVGDEKLPGDCHSVLFLRSNSLSQCTIPIIIRREYWREKYQHEEGLQAFIDEIEKEARLLVYKILHEHTPKESSRSRYNQLYNEVEQFIKKIQDLRLVIFD